MASALASVDISDSAHLKILLTETESPLVSIKEFQKSNAIALESLAPALPLLDLHDVSRFEFHDSVFEQLKLMLERRIEDISKLPKEESYQETVNYTLFSLVVIKAEYKFYSMNSISNRLLHY